jgi:nucleoside-diphosphate-sugar epimerase
MGKGYHNKTEYRGQRVVVLGASGFIGRWVSLALCELGANVHLVVRNKGLAKRVFLEYDVHGEIFEVDLRYDDAVRTLFQKIRPSITFNLAGYGVDSSERDEEIAYQINANLIRILCESVSETQNLVWQGSQVVHVGSALEYGEIGGHLSEHSNPNPTTLYGKSKLAGTISLTRYCQEIGVNGLTARLFTVYGPGEHSNRLLPSLFKTLRTKNPLELTQGKQRRDFTYVEDVAEALLLLGLTRTDPGTIVNVATGKLTSVRHFTEAAAKILEIPRDMLKFGALPTRQEEMRHSEVALNRLLQLISWIPPTAILEGIRKTKDFERSHHNLEHLNE